MFKHAVCNVLIHVIAMGPADVQTCSVSYTRSCYNYGYG